MRKLFAIIVCKLGHFVGKLIGKGSSMPGKFALKIFPDILRKAVIILLRIDHCLGPCS